MNDILPDLNRWNSEGRAIAIATVVNTWGSAPRAAGAKMGMTADSEISGSVSGGCIEGAVVEAGLTVIKSGRPQRLHFGVADETAWEVGLACGGEIDVFVQPLGGDIYAALRRSIEQEQLISRAVIVDSPPELLGAEVVVYPDGTTVGDLPPGLHERVVDKAIQELREDPSRPHAKRYVESIPSSSDEVEILVEVYPPPPALIIVGGVHMSIILVSLANSLGFRTVVIDPRRAFGSAARFDHADALYQTWPQEAFEEIQINESTAITMLTHDPKIDDPALHVALESPAFYIGALGSGKTQKKRHERLLQAGFEAEKINRIQGPIGLPLGGRNP
ncbi:MAG: XdhC family protein, partial [Anaerolineales bacterium]|nr:XdhC family protein [Anaerolineales bacterium]